MKWPNPFTGHVPGLPHVGAVDADSRIRMVASFSLEECNAALHVPRLQKTVGVAILRRVRQIRAGLERAS